MKKKVNQIWMNCIPLSYYKGRDVINLDYVIRRRNIRRCYENAFFLSFGYETIKEKKEVDSCLYKGKIGIINVLHERQQVTFDYECGAQVIDRHSTVGRSCEAAEQIINPSQGINGRLVQATESKYFSIDGTIYRSSETNPKFQAGESEVLISSQRFNNFELSTENESAVLIYNERSSEEMDQKCDPETFYHVSTVGRSCEAAEQNINSPKVLMVG
jgi:hypothetical protein